MRNLCSAASTLLIVVLTVITLPAWAGEAAKVMRIKGTVSTQAQDGSLKLLSKDSVINVGEIVQTESKSFAALSFTDGGRIFLRAKSRFMVSDYHYDPKSADKDSMAYELFKGAMRAGSGMIGKRGEASDYQGKTIVGTIGIRGTDYALQLCEDGDKSCAYLTLPTEGNSPPAGLYMMVFDGKVNITNNAASVDFGIGEAAYVRDINTAPVKLDGDTGMKKEFNDFPGILSLSGDCKACMVR